ncbi:MAG: aminoacyl-tRNA hydrolase [Candidatus Marinimicrobia bacterium]|nr:aminoacyl-tRNA hydrolase [Candidatus Neomarinimicrobiota bacterium]
MIAFVGLGNPGNKYADTKHNAGFWILDEMASRYKISFKPGKGDYVVAIKPNKFLLFKPTTGMNNSGKAVQDISNSWNLITKDICIILDDVDLPLDVIRIRPRGGEGSHRGLESIIYSLNTNEFPRLRFGIGTDEKMRPAENYVLKPFNSNDQKISAGAVKKAADALDSIIFNGLDKTMNIFNS